MNIGPSPREKPVAAQHKEIIMKNKSISELAKMYFEAPKNERGFVTAYANLKFGKEAWRDALSNCAAQPRNAGDVAPMGESDEQSGDSAQRA